MNDAPAPAEAPTPDADNIAGLGAFAGGRVQKPAGTSSASERVGGQRVWERGRIAGEHDDHPGRCGVRGSNRRRGRDQRCGGVSPQWRPRAGLALLVVLDTLTPPERLASVLHDLFGASFDEIAELPLTSLSMP